MPWLTPSHALALPGGLRPLSWEGDVREWILDQEPPWIQSERAAFELSGRYRRWLTRAMSLSVSEDCAGLGEGMLSGVVLIMYTSVPSMVHST